jgi:hypothetical protein
MFIVSSVLPDKYTGEGAEALYVIPKFILPASIFIGFVLGFYKTDKYDKEKIHNKIQTQACGGTLKTSRPFVGHHEISVR